MLILHNKSIQQHSGTSQKKMRLGLLSTHIRKIIMHTILCIKHKSYHIVWMCFWDYWEVWDSLDAHRDRRRTDWWTIGPLLVEQLPWLTQINLTWLLCCIKKNSNKIQHCWNLILAQYTLSWVICSNQTLPLHESHPCKGRLIRISERKNTLFFLTALAGIWCKTTAFLSYLENFPTSFWKIIPWAFVNSFSIPALGPLSKPCLNSVIMPCPFILKVAEPCEVLVTVFWNAVGAAIESNSEKDSCSSAELVDQEAAVSGSWKMQWHSWLAVSHFHSRAESWGQREWGDFPIPETRICLRDKEEPLSQNNHAEANSLKYCMAPSKEDFCPPSFPWSRPGFTEGRSVWKTFPSPLNWPWTLLEAPTTQLHQNERNVAGPGAGAGMFYSSCVSATAGHAPPESSTTPHTFFLSFTPFTKAQPDCTRIYYKLELRDLKKVLDSHYPPHTYLRYSI